MKCNKIFFLIVFIIGALILIKPNNNCLANNDRTISADTSVLNNNFVQGEIIIKFKPEAGKISEVLPLLNSGSVVGLENYGEVTEGALADLVIIDPSTPNMMPGYNIFADILYSLNNRNVDTVIVDGKVVVKNGKLLTIDVAELREKALEISKRMVATVSDKPMQSY